MQSKCDTLSPGCTEVHQYASTGVFRIFRVFFLIPRATGTVSTRNLKVGYISLINLLPSSTFNMSITFSVALNYCNILNLVSECAHKITLQWLWTGISRSKMSIKVVKLSGKVVDLINVALYWLCV
jgi:hypothetical protein